MVGRRAHIALVGLSGSGKSAVAPLLASLLGLRHVDTDREVERAGGLTVARLFEERGEAEFRRLEAREVERALAGPSAVISLGGGAVLGERSRRLVWERATVVWLRASPETLAARLRTAEGAEERPLLCGADPVERLRALGAQREALYAAAHLRLDTEGRAPEELAAEAARALGVPPETASPHSGGGDC